MIQAHNLQLDFGERSLFKKISFTVNQDQKIGLVGRNGAGKSTLLRVIAGTQDLDGGTVSIAKNKKIAYLPQEVVLLSEKPVLDEAVTVFENLVEVKEELEVFEEKLQGSTELTQTELDRYAQLQQEFLELDVDACYAQAKRILVGLGFTEQQLKSPVSELSVGWRMRLVLAKLLLQKADLYLFDEPTNHLDIVAKEWFVKFLKSSASGFLLVSHDRYFLDHVCDYTFALDRGDGRMYNGNYSKYLEQKAHEDEVQQAAFETQQKQIAQKMKTIERFRAKSSKAKMAQSMIKSLERMEKIEAVQDDQRAMKLNFGEVKRAGNIVLKISDVAKSFGEKKIFEGASFELKRGEKAAIVAPNGKGKTTLLNCIIGKLQKDAGDITFGHNVDYAIFEQDQNKLLNHGLDIIDEVENACTTSAMRAKARTMLGTFLFPGDDVYKKIRVLSGGERNRVAMVKVLLQEANFLMLDEPTNHLDLQSQEILLKALQSYPGTILFVSHDRTFLNGLATKIFDLDENGITAYEGNYDSYLYHKEQKELLNQGPGDIKKSQLYQQQAASKVSGKELYELKKRLAGIERKLEKQEDQLAVEQQKFEELVYGSKQFDEAQARVQKLEKSIQELYAEWEEIQDKIA